MHECERGCDCGLAVGTRLTKRAHTNTDLEGRCVGVRVLLHFQRQVDDLLDLIARQRADVLDVLRVSLVLGAIPLCLAADRVAQAPPALKTARTGRKREKGRRARGKGEGVRHVFKQSHAQTQDARTCFAVLGGGGFPCKYGKGAPAIDKGRGGDGRRYAGDLADGRHQSLAGGRAWVRAGCLGQAQSFLGGGRDAFQEHACMQTSMLGPCYPHSTTMGSACRGTSACGASACGATACGEIVSYFGNESSFKGRRSTSIYYNSGRLTYVPLNRCLPYGWFAPAVAVGRRLWGAQPRQP